MTVMVATLSQPLGPQQRVDEVGHQPHCDDAGERIVEDHDSLLTADRRRSCSRQTKRRSRRRPTDKAKKPTAAATKMTSSMWMLRAMDSSVRGGRTLCGGAHCAPLTHDYLSAIA